MCGIFGYSNNQSDTRAGWLLQSLAVEDTSRGPHATGISLLASDGIKTVKKAVTGMKFVAEGHSSILFRNKYRMAIGHNRYATTGDASEDANAHPFVCQVGDGRVSSIHNGIITNDAGKLEEIGHAFGLKTIPAVDSAVVIRSIAALHRRGSTPEEAIREVMEYVTGVVPTCCYSFIYMVESTKEMYLWTNGLRPLIFFDASRHGLGKWFASETQIFNRAWNGMAGALGGLDRVVAKKARIDTLYRLKNGIIKNLGKLDVAERPTASWKQIGQLDLPNTTTANQLLPRSMGKETYQGRYWGKR